MEKVLHRIIISFIEKSATKKEKKEKGCDWLLKDACDWSNMDEF